MKIFTQTTDFQWFDMTNYSRPDKTLFFDIETTGLSASSSMLYLIGALSKEGNCWKITEWFAENLSDEMQILKSFFEYISRFDTLVSYNGEGFDIPYITSVCNQYHIKNTLPDFMSVDIYKMIRPYKKLFINRDDNSSGCSYSISQKSMEKYMGIVRDDRLSGGELIDIYHTYIQTGEKNLLDLVLRHNMDDLKGLYGLQKLLLYESFFKGDFKYLSNTCMTEKFIINMESGVSRLPKNIIIKLSDMCIQSEGSLLHFDIEIKEDSMKHFFSDYKNYFYLPMEDTAVHKSIGEFVDRQNRIKATAKTAYIRREDRFIPRYANPETPVFSYEYRGKEYISLQDFLICTNKDRNLFSDYVLDILTVLRLR